MIQGCFFALTCFSTAACHSSVNDKAIESISLLSFHTNEWLDSYSASSEEEMMLLNESEKQKKWEEAATLLYAQDDALIENDKPLFQKAYRAYQKAECFEKQGLTEEAKEAVCQASRHLQRLREKMIDAENALIASSSANVVLYQKKYKGPLDELMANQSIPEDAKRKMAPYIISETHPLYSTLDAIFKTARVTQDETVFHGSGFKTICQRPRTFVRVASHPLLDGHLVKIYLDTELRKKQGRDSWEWFVKRCEGADKVRNVLVKKRVKYFVVADKWIYPLPENPAPLVGSRYTRHLAVLLVKNMNLVDDQKNLYAWSHYITKEHLNELYDIITYAKGSSYRPDNITYTKQGTFAFIDTEYPGRGPDYKSIRRYLNSSMRKYWDKLVKNGR